MAGNEKSRARSTPTPVTKDDATPRPLPQTKRGLKTRSTLVEAARFIFERDGFLDSRLADITAQAECSIGSFYTYFDSKDEIFAAVMDAAKADMLHPGVERIDADDDPEALIRASNRSYLEAYARNAKLMGLLEQVASIDPAFREVRRQRGLQFIQRNARSIANLQERGLADPALEPVMTSRALSAMVSRLGYQTYVLDDGGTLDELVEISTRIWCNALKLKS